jgi:hypothetical protein
MTKSSKTVLIYPSPTKTPTEATKEEVMRLVQDVSQLISKKSDKAAVILTEWLSRESSRSIASRKKAG